MLENLPMGNIRSSKKVKLPLLTVLKVNTNLKTWNQYQVTVLAKKKGSCANSISLSLGSYACKIRVYFIALNPNNKIENCTKWPEIFTEP